MSIQTELTRITNAKAAIKAAVEGKGVTVPDGTLLDGMAALIESIEAGGGRVARGTWVQASDGYYKTITHNLGKVPEFAVIWETNGNSSAKEQCLIGVALTSINFYMRSTGTGSFGPYGQYYSDNASITGSASSSTSVFGDANTTTITFSNLNNQIIAGSSYEYIIM